MTTQELIDLLANEGNLSGVTNDQVGRLVNPESKPLTGWQKVLSNAAAFRGVFGEDSERLGADFKKALVLDEVTTGLAAKRQQQKKQADMLGLLDTNNQPGVQMGELPQSQQSRLRSEGLAPKKTEDISSQVLGPTRSLFQDVMQPDESGGLIPDEFGGAFESKQGIGPSETGKKALGSSQGGDLLSALVGGDQVGLSTDPQGRQGVEQIARQFDPGLQASQEVEDPDATLPNAVAMQAFDSLTTDLRTPRSQSEGMTSDTINPLLASMGLDQLPKGLSLPPNVATTFLQQVGQQQGREFSQQQINDRLKEKQEFSRKERLDRQQWTEEFTKTKSDISTQSQLYVDGVIKERELILMGADANNKSVLEQQRSQNSLRNSLEIAKVNNEFDSQKAVVNEASKYFHNLLDGQQQLDQAYFSHTLTLAEERAKESKDGSSVSDMFKTTVKETIKANPGLARDMTLMLSLLPKGSIPEETERLTRRAIADTINTYRREQLAQGRASVILRGGDQGVGEDFSTTPAKAAALEAEILDVKAGRSSADIGTLMEALSFVQELDIDKTKDLTEKQQENLAVATTMLNSVNIMKQTYDNAYTGKYGSALAEWRIAAAEGGRAVGLPPVITDFVDLPEVGKKFFSESQALTKQLINLTGGLALTPMELALVEATQPVIQNPNFRNQLDVFERNIMDLRDAREAVRNGNAVERQRIIDRITKRSQDFLAKNPEVGSTAPSSQTSSEPFKSKVDAQQYLKNELSKGRNRDEILSDINKRGVRK